MPKDSRKGRSARKGPAAKQEENPGRPHRRRPAPTALAAATLLLLALTLAAFGPAVENGFLNYDDDSYVLKNRPVRAGLNAQGVHWAFTSLEAANWHPLTWLSHMADVEFHGLDPAGHHRTNVILHLLNTLLLLAGLYLATGALWRGFLAAALFAVHPLHVESVAWVAERKDVLSGLLWMLTIIGYVFYARRPSPRRFLAVFLLLAAGLLAKPMLVTLPLVLLLLDFWPLDRMKPGKDGSRPLLLLVREKVPLFALAAICGVITLIAQERGGAVNALDSASIPERLANVLVSYATYLWKTLWPRGLAVFYPYPVDGVPWIAAIGSAVPLLGFTWLVWRDRERRWLLTGWLWYVVSLVPVIGLVQVGAQAMADRYTYLPLIGIFLALAWGAGELAWSGETARRVVPVAAAIVLILLVPVTRSQVRVWKTSVTLFRHALSLTPDNAVARLNLGEALASSGEIDEAIGHFQRALQIQPGNPTAHSDLGVSLASRGRLDEAITHYREAVRLKADYPEAHNNLGNALLQKGLQDEAVAAYRRALAIAPDYANAHNNLGNALFQKGELDQATLEFRKAQELEPDDAKSYYNLGCVADRQGRPEEALARYRDALRLKPDYPEVLNNMGIVLANQGKKDAAVAAFNRALELRPGYEEARGNLKLLLQAASP